MDAGEYFDDLLNANVQEEADVDMNGFGSVNQFMY